MELRPYQKQAVTAVHNYLCKYPDRNPCVCLPCASGKSVVIAACIRHWKAKAPWMRACILAHRKELVSQNYSKLKTIAPELDVGIYSAGLNKKDECSNIIYASIDSIYRHAGKFTPFDVVIVDEAHRIPASGEGKYRTFIRGSMAFNDRLRVVGFTATPFRMDCGQICHRDYVLNELAFSANIRDLIDEKYLSRIRSKCGKSQPDLAETKKAAKGDYVLVSLGATMAKKNLVFDAVSEAVSIIESENRHHVIVYCVDIAHCQLVTKAFASCGMPAVMVTGKTPQDQRDKIVQAFKRGKIRILCNVNVFTEGFDSPNIDAIVLLRPTLSKGMYSQMVGRGLRLCPGKRDCLVLDFARCIEEHGPIDLLDGPKVVEATCHECRESFSRALRKCPQCGWEIPRLELERLDQSERQKRLHERKASSRSILSGEPEVYEVDEVFVSRHKKDGMPDSVCLTFRCGLKMFPFWLCLDHEGWIGEQAQQWYRKYFPEHKRKHVSVDKVLDDMFFPQKVKEIMHTVKVVRDKKYDKIVEFN